MLYKEIDFAQLSNQKAPKSKISKYFSTFKNVLKICKYQLSISIHTQGKNQLDSQTLLASLNWLVHFFKKSLFLSLIHQGDPKYFISITSVFPTPDQKYTVLKLEPLSKIQMHHLYHPVFLTNQVFKTNIPSAYVNNVVKKILLHSCQV